MATVSREDLALLEQIIEEARTVLDVEEHAAFVELHHTLFECHRVGATVDLDRAMRLIGESRDSGGQVIVVTRRIRDEALQALERRRGPAS